MAAIGFQNALGIHSATMPLRAKRAELLASNLANADTPGYKARDINFQAVLAGEVSNKNYLSMSTTRQGHISGSSLEDSQLLYRNPSQPSIDGNTVDTQIEQSLYAKNNLDYTASFEFLSRKFKGLKGAIRGD